MYKQCYGYSINGLGYYLTKFYRPWNYLSDSKYC